MAQSVLHHRYITATALLAVAIVAGGVAKADDFTSAVREAAKTWGMHRIAVIQAADGDVQGAKRTLSQIDAGVPRRAAEVTTVWFCNRTPIYEQGPTMPVNGADWQPLLNRGPQPAGVPTRLLPGLPPNYLAADPRHGRVADFTDDYDVNGTRITSRKYADGALVIETPR